MEMGTGKTKVAIDNAAYLYTINEINTVIVLAPNSVYRNWEKEINMHCSVDYTITMHKEHNKFDYQHEKLMLRL